jgi:Flp pilus assembly protein TadG
VRGNRVRGVSVRGGWVRGGWVRGCQGRPGSPRARRPDAGSAIVEFVLVSTLLLFLFLGIIQLGLVLHIRNTLAANAAEGARHGANLDVDPADGGPYAQLLIAQSIPGRADTHCVGSQIGGPDDIPLVQVTCQVRVPLSLLPFGGGVTVRVTGHAVKETS